MPTQVYGTPFDAIASAQYAGAGAAVALTDAPTNAGGFGKTLTQADALLPTLNTGDAARVSRITFSIEGGTAHVLTDGNTPTAAIGIAYGAGQYERENDAEWIHTAKFFLPVGVTLNVEYGP